MAKICASLAILVLSCVYSAPSQAGDAPTAIVEEISGIGKAVQFMEYLLPGKKIDNGGGRLVIGYLRSCVRETIEGGQVTIGQKQSTVTGGKVSRERVECDGGNLQNMASQGSGSAVTVFRAKPGIKNNLPKSQLTIYSTMPMVSLISNKLPLKIVRLDKKAKPINVNFQGLISDFAKLKIQLSPGGLYRLNVGEKSLVFSVDPLAEASSKSLLQRLIRF